MRYGKILMLCLGLTSLALAAPEKAAPAKAAQEKTATQDKESYLQKANQELQDWTAKIKALEERSEKSGVNTRHELDQHLKAIDDKLAVARKKLEELRHSSENAWKNLRDGLDKALGDVTHHYQKAVSTLDKDKKKEKS